MSAPSILLETSGSEGCPKRIALNYQTLRASALMGQALEALRTGDCWLNCLPQTHVGGLAIHYRCEQAGANMLLHSGFNPERVQQDIEQYAVTHISLVPVMLSKLLDQYGDEPAPESLRTVLMGGDRLPKELAVRAVNAGWPIVVSYGMTETASRITLLRLSVDTVTEWEESDVGSPLPGVSLTIGDAGEVRIRSEQLFPGEEKEVVTGDSGSIDECGHLHIHGRLDDQILSAGYLVDPLEVEQQLLSCPSIRTVAVAGRADSEWGALVVAVTEQPLSSSAHDWIEQNLSSYQRPRYFVVVEQLKRNSSGKLDRQWLKLVVEGVVVEEQVVNDVE